MKILFKTIVGSRAWDMQRPDSDIDIFQVYIVPTRDILSGIFRQNSHFTSKEDKDESKHEIGSIIEQLIKGNFNFVVGICSPIIEEDKYGYLAELRDITQRNLAKNIYHSTKGLAIHNYRKYFVNVGTITETNLQKKRNLIVRSLIFGEWILSSRSVRFIKIEDQTNEDIHYWMNGLDEAYNSSVLPEIPDPTEFRNFLYRLRIAELEDKLGE